MEARCDCGGSSLGHGRMKIESNPQEEAMLREAAAEIKAVLRKYDIAGIVNLQGRDTAHYFMEISPTWSCMFFEPGNGNEVKVCFKAAVKTGGPEEKERARVTSGMVMGFLDIIAVQEENLGTVAFMIGKHLEVEHGSRRF